MTEVSLAMLDGPSGLKHLSTIWGWRSAAGQEPPSLND